MRISVLAIVTVLAELACVPWAAAAPANAGSALQKGIGEFQAGAYTQALADFLDAQRSGLDTPVLHYNLGATYYKLNRDQQAESEFRSLLGDPKFSEFARYNLGLIAHRAGRQTEAHDYFSAVASGKGNAHLRALARNQLRPASHDKSRWHGVLELAGGHDDNVTLTEHTTLVTPSGSGSTLASAFASGSGRIAGDAAGGLWLNGSVRDIRYFKQTAFDLLVARAAPEYRFTVNDWRLRTVLNATYIRLGTASLETLLGFNLRAEHALGIARVRLDYGLTRINGGARYGYLTGWQNQLGLHSTWRPGPVQISLGYALTLNRRQDRTAGSEFSSVSPMRNQVDADLRWTPASWATLYAGGSYWRSRYADPNAFLQGTTLVVVRRSDSGRNAEVGALFNPSNNTRLGAAYEYRSNDANIARYAFTSHRYTLRVQYVY